MERETSLKIEDQDGRFMLSDYSDNTIWFALYLRRSHVSVVLTKEEAQKLIADLQQFLTKEEVAA